MDQESSSTTMFPSERDGEPLLLSLMHPLTTVVCRTEPPTSARGFPRSRVLGAVKTLSLFVSTPRFIRIVSAGVRSLFPGGMWELGFFNRSCRYSLTAPRVLCEATKQEARSLAAHTEQSFLQRSDCRIADAFSCRVSTREVRLTEPYNHLVKVRPGPSYSVVTHWLSFSLHLGVSKVAQAPDLPWGVLVTVSPQTLGAESWTLQKNITQSSRARRSSPRPQLRCRVLHFWWFGLASCQLTPATGTAGVELLKTAEQSPAGRSETATKGKPKGRYKANRERLCF